MNDEQHFLANAYLDGELTADERRIAEADPEVMTEVAVLRALQTELRAVPAPTAAARESAISAAMAAFADPVGGATGASAVGGAPGRTRAPVVSVRPRPAYAKYLGIAAAFVAVAGLGIIVAQGGSGDDDDSADTATELLDDGAAERTEAALIESSGTADAAESEIMVAEDADDGGTFADEAVAEELTAEPTADQANDLTVESTGGSPAASGGQYREVPPDFDPEAPITNDDELGIYGAHLIAERDGERLPPTPNHSCVDAEQILDGATVLLDGEVVPVYVDVRETDGRVAALHTDTCVELLRGSLFPG